MSPEASLSQGQKNKNKAKQDPGEGKKVKTYRTRHNSPLLEYLPRATPLPFQHQNSGLRHARLIPSPFRNRHVQQTLLPQQGRELVVRVHDRFANVAGRFARGGQVVGGLGGDDEDFAAGFADGGEEALQGFQVGHAERAPVAAEVWVG